jgi:hypothetical protein
VVILGARRGLFQQPGLSVTFLMPFLLSYETESMESWAVGKWRCRIYPQPDRESGGAEAVRLIGDCKVEGAGAGRSEWLYIKI